MKIPIAFAPFLVENLPGGEFSVGTILPSNVDFGVKKYESIVRESRPGNYKISQIFKVSYKDGDYYLAIVSGMLPLDEESQITKMAPSNKNPKRHLKIVYWEAKLQAKCVTVRCDQFMENHPRADDCEKGLVIGQCEQIIGVWNGLAVLVHEECKVGGNEKSCAEQEHYLDLARQHQDKYIM